jgi:uncharacterized Zn finger protein (UPF0148 family)
MKYKYKIDEYLDCPVCGVQLISYDGKNVVCPLCAIKEIERLETIIRKLKSRRK